MLDNDNIYYIRRCAEIEEWANIRPYDDADNPCACAEVGLTEGEIPLIGQPSKDEDDCYHLYNYPSDLNAQARVFRKICFGSVENTRLVEDLVDKYQFERVSHPLAYLLCLTAEEQWPILCAVIDRLKGKEK